MNISQTKTSWVFMLCDVLLLTTAFYIGGIQFLLDNDTTYISMLIISIYFMTNFLLIALAKAYDMYQISYYQNCIRYVINTCLSLGLLGTVLGFTFLLYNLFDNIDLSDIENTKNIISQMTHSMGISLLTTITGIVSSITIYLKYTVLGYE